MSSPEYKEHQKKMRQHDAVASMTKFLYVGIKWLELNFHCKREGILKFMQFFVGRMREIGRDDDLEYFADAEQRLQEMYGISVMGMMGIRITEEGELEFHED